ncbi:MAG: DNA mismatch repair protein MutS [Alphaproteobacteria bacterium]
MYDLAPEQGPFSVDDASLRTSRGGRAADAITPMMVQWHETKSSHPDCLLFFRMGDFYELFFDDAVAASGALDIALTKRGTYKGAPVPMAGVPVHSAEQYLERLIRHGFRVAVCEQMEDPAEARKRGAKAVVRRAVVRVVTPGTLTEDSLLDARSHNFLAALAEAQDDLGLAWLDISTGELWLQRLEVADVNGLGAALERVAPGELLVPERMIQRPELFEIFEERKEALTPLPTTRFDSTNALRRLEGLFGVRTLEAFGDPSRAEVAAAGALVDYVELTQCGKLPRLDRPRRLPPPGRDGAVMEIDSATRRNLELGRTLGGERKGSLLAVMDRTVTAGGGRLLAAGLAAPLTDVDAIEERLDMVAYFHGDDVHRSAVREDLRRSPDLDRALSRLSVERGGPRDLAAVRDALATAGELRTRLGETRLTPPPAGVAREVEGLGFHDTLVNRLGRALGPELPTLARDGGFIAPGYALELDAQRELRDESRRLVAGLQKKYAESSGVPSLKVRHNNVLGYYIEVTATHADKLISRSTKGPDGTGADLPFIHRQTMANAVRFSTVELGELEDKIARAADRALAIEIELFRDLVGEVTVRIDEIGRTAKAIATLDVACALAELAHERGYCRPEVSESTEFRVTGGRHPVVEAALEASGEAAFVANDCDLSDGQRLWLLTGPNMAGKSTFLRQNALIAVMAQTGSFVPAEAARIGVADRLFSRVGAADDLARGRSTFMVEMVETATILNQATERSLVILDEIGRGTATFDGLSIAWGTVEHLHDVNRCRTLFATHYHELTSLASRLSHLACHTMRVKEWQGDVVFLHEVAPGTADRSYGIHVGRLAGLPGPVVRRAEDVLALLEEGEQGSALTRLAEDLPLFQAATGLHGPRPAAGDAPSPVEALLAEIRPDELTPRDALELIYRLKALLDGGA